MSALVSHSSTMSSSLVGRNGSGSVLSPFEVSTLLTLPVLSPDMSFHWDDFGGLTLDGLTVLKKLLNCMWNFGETNPFCRYRIKATNYVCLVEGPRLIPSLTLASQL